VKWQFIVAELVWHGHHQDSYLMTVPQPSHCLHTQLFYELRVCWQCSSQPVPIAMSCVIRTMGRKELNVDLR
jgi:hypothetical protein